MGKMNILKSSIKRLAVRTGYDIVRRPSATATVRVAFVHVPKCAGTSLDYAIRKAANANTDGWVNASVTRRATRIRLGSDAPDTVTPALLGDRQYMALQYFIEDKPVVSGHFAFSRLLYDRFGNRYQFVTVLRDPVERWISHYVYNKFHNRDPSVIPCRNDDVDALAELETIIESGTGHFMSHLYCVVFGEYDLVSTNPSQAVDIARENLRKFRVIGFTDDFGSFRRRFATALRLNIDVGHLNRTSELPVEPAAMQRVLALFNQDIRERLRGMCRADCEIYEAARSLS